MMKLSKHCRNKVVGTMTGKRVHRVTEKNIYSLMIRIRMLQVEQASLAGMRTVGFSFLDDRE